MKEQTSMSYRGRKLHLGDWRLRN